ncbi:MAG: VTC domain-containing protein [Candidatus Sericytochromatia bacterium]
MIRRFNRFELKYILEMGKANALMRELALLTEPDPHDGNVGYAISSLYYDSPELDFFWAKIEGIKYRRKIRIRVYPGDAPDALAQAMVEIKQRINKTVQKRRLRLPLEEAYQLCKGRMERLDLDPVDQTVASEIQYLVQAKHLQPTAVIAYFRRAFMGTIYNPGLRITFDTHLKVRTHSLKLENSGAETYFLDPDWCIMEIKVNDTVPDWVSSLLTQYNCQLNRVSKYCAGLAHAKQLHVAPLVHNAHGQTSPLILPAALRPTDPISTSADWNAPYDTLA